MAQGRPKRQRGRSTLTLRAAVDLFLELRPSSLPTSSKEFEGSIKKDGRKATPGKGRRANFSLDLRRLESLRGRWEAAFRPREVPPTSR